jgi:transposase
MNITEFIDGIPIDEYRVNMIKIPKEELERFYITEKKSIKEIAKHFKCHYRTIYNRLKKLNIPLEKGRPRKKIKHFLGKNQLTELLKKDITIDNIAKKLRTTPEIVRRYIKKYGL